jgi:hypothetical protein
MTNETLLQNLSYATLLSLDYGKSSGSGFLLTYLKSTFLVTARHVLIDDQQKLRGDRVLVSSQQSKSKEEEAAIFEIDLKVAKVFYNNIDDIAVIPLGGILIEQNNYVTVVQNVNSEYITIPEDKTRTLDEIGISNEVFLIGFPTSLIFQSHKLFDVRKPLLRKGIIAGLNNADCTFIIDCSAYFGNSGGPIVEVCEDGVLRIIGVVSKYIPFVVEWRNNRETSISHAEYLNSGYSVCVPMDAIYNLIAQNLI